MKLEGNGSLHSLAPLPILENIKIGKKKEIAKY
jgi:hypothetical protein